MPFGVIQALLNAKAAKKSNKVLNDLLNEDPTYKKNPLVGQQFDFARQLFGARMFGAQDQERNILSSQGSFQNNINRNATDASQVLALSAAGQAQTNQAFSNLGIQEKQNKYGLLSNLNQAYGNMINEDDKVYNDQIRRFGNKASVRGAQLQNLSSINTGFANGINSDLNEAFNVLGMFGGGGMNGSIGGRQGQQQQQQQYGGMSGGWPGWSPQQRYNYP